MRITPYLRTLKNLKFFRRTEVNDKVYNIVRIFDPAKKPTRYFTPFLRPISKKLIPWKAINKIIDEDEYLICHGTFLRSFELFNKNVLDYVHYIDNGTCYRLYFNFAYGKPVIDDNALDIKFISEISPWLTKKGVSTIEIEERNKTHTIAESIVDSVFVLDFSPINVIVPKLYYGLKANIRIVVKRKSIEIDLHNPFIIGRYYLKGKELIKPEFFMEGTILNDIGKKCNNTIKYLKTIPLLPTWRELFKKTNMHYFAMNAESIVNRLSPQFKNMYYMTWIWSWLLEYKYPDLYLDASSMLGDYINKLVDRKLIK